MKANDYLVGLLLLVLSFVSCGVKNPLVLNSVSSSDISLLLNATSADSLHADTLRVATFPSPPANKRNKSVGRVGIDTLAILRSIEKKKNAVKKSVDKVMPLPIPKYDTLQLQQMDSVPDFLQPFVGDSTIHVINAYGIPFIIDDSVPMLLPPIDKNPQGYVSSQAYQFTSRGGGINNFTDKIAACGIMNPIDSILWLNKCINDLPEYAELYLEPTQFYYFIINLITTNEGYCFFGIFAYQYFEWGYYHSDYHKGLTSKINYYYDLSGNLLGKMYIDIPTSTEHPLRVIPLRSNIPNYDLFSEKYLSNTHADRLIRLLLSVLRPNTATPH